MRKLYNLKSWYSLEDAAKRLTITLGEDFSVKDMLQLTVEGHLPLSWNIRHVAAQEIAPYTRICNWDSLCIAQGEVFYKSAQNKLGYIMPLPQVENGNAYGSDTLTVMPCLKVQSEVVEYLDGPHRLDLEMCGAIKDWVISLITGTGGELISLDGYFVRDSNGGLWRIMNRFTKEEMEAKNKARLGLPPPLPPGYKKPFNHYDYFYPSGDSPDEQDLGIIKNDMEAFEALALNTKPAQHAKEKSLSPKERDSLLKLVLGMAIDAYGYNPKATRSSTAGQIASDLKTRGISIDEDTVRKWLNQAKEVVEVLAEELTG